MASRICGVEVMPRHSALRIRNPPQPCPPGGPTCSADRISHAASFHAAGICRQPKQMYPVMHRHAQRELRSSACEHCSFSRPRPRNEKARKHNHKSNGVHSSAPGSHHQGGQMRVPPPFWMCALGQFTHPARAAVSAALSCFAAAAALAHLRRNARDCAAAFRLGKASLPCCVSPSAGGATV